MNLKLKSLAILFGCALMVTACDSNKVDPSKVKPDDGVTPIDQIVIDDGDKDDETPIITKTCTEISAGSCGGSLTDLLVGSYIEPTYSYTCSFTHNKTFSGEYTVRSDDRTIAQVTHEAGTGAFVVKGISAGDAIITAKTEEDEIVLQFVVKVRNRMPMSKIPEHLYSVDKYTGMGYGYKLSFTSKDPLMATMVGSDDFESTFVNFKLIEGVEEKIDESLDFNTYKYKISVDTSTSTTSRNYTYIYIATTGEKIYMYYSNGLVDIFTSYGLSIYSNNK